MELKKKEGTWWVGFQTDHGLKWKNTHAQLKEEAEQVVATAKISQIEMTARASKLTGEVLSQIMAGRKITCVEVLEEWINVRATTKSPNTVQSQTYAVSAFLSAEKAANKIVNRIDSEDVNAYINKPELGARGNREAILSALRSYFDFAVARGYMLRNPASRHVAAINHRALTHEQKESKPRTPFTPAEYKTIISNTEGFWRWSTALGYWCGFRLADVCNLEWSSIKGNEIVAWTRKFDARVALPMSDHLIGGGELALIVLEMMDGASKGRYVFPEQREIINNPQKRAKLSVTYGRILERLNIEGKSFHCLRHSFCTRLDKAGRTEEEIGKLVGHQDTETTKGYIHK